MARRGGDASRQVVVSVVGVSGGEREKGVTGLGKSCLCNRFTKPQSDQYHVDHISVLSQTDFSGRVVNNDHFLYWGECARMTDDGFEFVFQVVEQTEFIDDASFMPFKAGKMDPYIKRCCATKIQSAEKLMYICKNQLGIEKEYEQRVLPDGKLNVDGFLCVFDVSQVPNRSLERQVELTASILNNCLKTKRPVVLVTTKNDEANEVYVKEAEKLASRKEFKGNIPLVETSSHENINVDCAFMTLANLVDRNRGRIRIVPFYEAARHRKEILDVATDAFQRLVRTHVLDYRSIWASTSKKLAQSPEFIHYVDLFGMDQAAKLFRRHVKKLKEEYLQRKVEGYMDLLPSILREFFPDLQSLEDGDWLSIQQRISEHPEFDRYFLRCNEDIPWSENTELLDSADTRIPFDVLDSNEAETVFKNHVNALQAELEMREMRDRFKLLLAETGYVTPGKRLDEVRVLFMGRESFDSLSEHDRQFIYDQHQKDITEKARQNFHELLLEQAELFYHVKSIAPTGTITQEDIRDITQTLQEDSRYKALDRLESERTLLLLQHLGFVHCPKKEHCPTFPNCMDCLIEKIIANKAASNSRPGSGTWSSKTAPDPQVNLVLLGNQGLADDLQNVIRSVCEDDEFELDNQIFSLDYRSIDGDVSLPQNSFKTPEFTPHGVVCAYSNEASLEYVRESLEKSLLTQLEREESAPTPPITVLFAPDPDLDHNASQHLHDEGANLADSLQCTFMDVGPSVGGGEGRRFDSSLVTKALRSLITSIQHRNNSLNIYNSAVLPRDSQPDIRIIMCMLCGDPYSVENVLSPLLSHQWCVVTGEQSISLQTFLDDCKRRVEVIVSSYHGANAFREDLVHGFILVYSTKRKASLATLRAFSANIPNLPIQILAMTDTSSATAFFKSDISQQLITEGNAIADRLQAHFMTSTATCQQKTAFYTPFFKEVWDKKPEIEQAFNMEDPSGLDDSGEGTLERPSHHYHRSITLPPPRRNMPPRSQSAEGSSSEIYETVPTDGSLGDDLDEPLSPVFPDDQPLTPSDDSDIYSHIDNDEEEHLVKPSQFKKQHRFQQELFRQSYPSTESLPTTVSSRSKVSTQPSDLEPTYPPLPPYPPPPPSTSPPPYSFVSRDQSFDSGNGGTHPRDGASSPSLRDRPPPPYSFAPRTLPHDMNKPQPAPRHQFFKAESLTLEHGASDRDYHLMPDRADRGGLQVYPPPTTPPEPAPPDRECVEGPPRRLVKATTLPTPTLLTTTSRTSLDELTSDLSGSRDSLTTRDSGWQDDSMCSRRVDDYWGDTFTPQAFTTGRRAKFPPPPTKPRPKASQTLKTFQSLSEAVYQVTTKQPGKLNLKAYSNVTDAIGKINLKDAGLLHSKLTKGGSVHAPLATPENMDLGTDYAAVKDAVPGLYGSFEAGEYGYSRVQDLPQGAGSKARRQRREKGRQAYSDSDSEWSSLERRRSTDSYKVNRKAVPKRMKKKRLPIPVAAPRVPPLPSFYVAEGAPGTRYSDERLLLDPYEKVVSGSASDDSEGTDREDPTAPHSKYKPQKHTISFKKKMGGREGVAVRPPVVPPLPPTHNLSHPPTSHPRMGLAATPHHNPLSYPLVAQLPPDTELFSPSFPPGKLEGDHVYRVIPEDDSSLEVSSPRDQQSPILPPGAPARKDTDKTARRKQEKLRSREEARQREEERKRAKDEEKMKKAAEKEKEREKKKAKGSAKGSAKGPPQPTLEDFVQSPERSVPLFLEKCVYFIELEGLDSEGIYRVPGNKVHVEQLTTKFKEDSNVNFAELDIPVNAAATALKDYLKQLPPLLPQNQLMELTTIASIGDRSLRLLRLKEMLTGLPRVNFEVLKFIFQHFVRVAENCKLNSMDSKNLAICWWPTLLHTLQFSDIAEFESQRPHIEDIIQTMIDQFPFLFQGKEDYVMV
ncbi:rho GTPase-activating protein 190-like isoform X3 [Eriocheir sinensis]|uniref:rho GTPase-activating protein 190-like isoform X3 n=1 Tax=Eriocheir sinensis TaxID=95602 RepID=UPI0021C803DF|nr:rho GTPase-activating protein 190-like isoform X3 [Eriocheir sinensis]